MTNIDQHLHQIQADTDAQERRSIAADRFYAYYGPECDIDPEDRVMVPAQDVKDAYEPTITGWGWDARRYIPACDE